MEKSKLELKYNALLKAYTTLRKAIEIINKNTSEDTQEKLLLRDGMIQRFEYCYDLFWKYLKEFLYEKHGLIVNSPRTVFQESFKQNMINEEELRIFYKLIDERNKTSHTYNEIDAEIIGQNIIEYAIFFDSIIVKILP